MEPGIVLTLPGGRPNSDLNPQKYLKVTARSGIISTLSDGEQSNRLFVILAVALLGLICIGLMGLVSAVFLVRQNRQAEEAIVVLPTSTISLPTFTPTATITPTPTNTPEPTSTATLVVNPAEGQPAGEPLPAETVPPGATPTNTLVVQPIGTDTPIGTPVAGATAPPAGQIPAGGGVLEGNDTSYLAWLSIATLALLTFGAFNYVRLNRYSPKK